MPSTLVITGTDTGVGKTFVGCALARALCARGVRVLAVKPIETGCPGPPTVGEDGAQLAAATGQRDPAHALVRLPAPLAPAEAADRAGRRLDLDALAGRVRALAAGADVALVEGAGGLLTPLTWERDLTDLARALDARVLVIAADRLGAINQTRLVLGALTVAALPLAGVVLSAPAERDGSTGANAAAIARCSPGTVVVAVPRASAPGDLAAPLAPLIDRL
ncbi:MAG TPA: dethiobiotin synthase [Polyangiaceae bacterium]|nr:dethiobiotin synthase [Polyangiaceae bacterium]